MPETRKPKRQPPLHPSVEKVDELLAYILTLPARSSWHPYQEREFKARLFKTLASPDTGSTEKTRRKNHAPPWARAMVVILNLFQAEVPGAFDLPDPSTLEEPPVFLKIFSSRKRPRSRWPYATITPGTGMNMLSPIPTRLLPGPGRSRWRSLRVMNGRDAPGAARPQDAAPSFWINPQPGTRDLDGPALPPAESAFNGPARLSSAVTPYAQSVFCCPREPASSLLLQHLAFHCHTLSVRYVCTLLGRCTRNPACAALGGKTHAIVDEQGNGGAAGGSGAECIGQALATARWASSGPDREAPNRVHRDRH